jgi:hypothetical protein
MIDVVELVKDIECKFEWTEVCSEYKGYKLYIKVFRDAMKFDNIPALQWNFKLDFNDIKIYNGVRLPASAHQLQTIAYLLDSMLLTPKVIDLINLQSQLTFNAIVSVGGEIVATSNITDVHSKIEEEIAKLGGDDGTKLISCVGKYWCLMNKLRNSITRGDYTACNYGWFATDASGPGITKGTRCWQRPGYRHNKMHYDPSQTIRLMHRKARLVHPDGTEVKVDLYDIALNDELAYLLHHEGKLTYLEQQGVEKPAFPYVKPVVVTPEPPTVAIPEPVVEEPQPIIEKEEDKPIYVKPISESDNKEEVEEEIKTEKPANSWQAFWVFILMLFRKIFKL